MNKSKGIFISFEGPEASGKSSQIKLLSNYLKKNKIPHVVTREPGGTKLAEKLRKLILANKSKINNTEEILLLMAARSNHLNNFIKPNLKKIKLLFQIVLQIQLSFIKDLLIILVFLKLKNFTKNY